MGGGGGGGGEGEGEYEGEGFVEPGAAVEASCEGGGAYIPTYIPAYMNACIPGARRPTASSEGGGTAGTSARRAALAALARNAATSSVRLSTMQRPTWRAMYACMHAGGSCLHRPPDAQRQTHTYAYMRSSLADNQSRARNLNERSFTTSLAAPGKPTWRAREACTCRSMRMYIYIQACTYACMYSPPDARRPRRQSAAARRAPASS